MARAKRQRKSGCLKESSTKAVASETGLDGPKVDEVLATLVESGQHSYTRKVVANVGNTESARNTEFWVS